MATKPIPNTHDISPVIGNANDCPFKPTRSLHEARGNSLRHNAVRKVKIGLAMTSYTKWDLIEKLFINGRIMIRKRQSF